MINISNKPCMSMRVIYRVNRKNVIPEACHAHLITKLYIYIFNKYVIKSFRSTFFNVLLTFLIEAQANHD
jgi:hypothetical protein